MGLKPQGHTQECRTRVEGELAKTPDGRRRLAEVSDRITHFAAQRIEDQERAAPARVAGSIPTAPTDAAGAMISSHHKLNINQAEKSLKNHDSYNFLMENNMLVKTGGTNTNLGDIVILTMD